MSSNNEIEIKKITNYNKYYKFHQNLLTEQERNILNKMHSSIAYVSERINTGWLDQVCRLCKNIFIIYENDYVICSKCKKILDAEIDEFEDYVYNKYENMENNRNNGVYNRVKLILFCEREKILNKKFNSCAFYYYMQSNKINIGINNVYKVSRTLKNIYESIYRYDGCIDFDFLRCDYGYGSGNRKMTKALKISVDLIPEIFTKYYEKYMFYYLGNNCH